MDAYAELMFSLARYLSQWPFLIDCKLRPLWYEIRHPIVYGIMLNHDSFFENRLADNPVVVLAWSLS